MSINYKIVFFIFLISKTYESYQKSLESFKELLPYEYKIFKGKGEFFFRYMVKKLGGDIAIEIPEAPQLKGEIYIYTIHSKILKQYENWENYMFKFKLSSNQIYTIKKNDNRLSYNNLFIIIKLYNDIDISSRIRVYSELEIYNLKLDEIYQLEHFLSSNKLSFLLETTQGNTYELNIRGNPDNKHRIIIYENGNKNNIIYNITKINPKLSLTPLNDTDYILEIENYYYKHDTIKFISYSIFHESIPLNFDVKKLYFFNNEEYFFYINVTDFSFDEFTISISVDKKEILDLINSFNGKFYIPRNLPITEINEFYPINNEQNEFVEYSFNTSEKYYKQLIFKKQNNTKNEIIYILLYIKVKSTPSIHPENFTLFLTKSSEMINLKRKNFLILSPKYMIDIPYYFTLILPTNKNITIFIYTNETNYLDITYGNLLTINGNINLKKEKKNDIYILNTQQFQNLKKEKYIRLTLTLISQNKNPEIYIDLTKDKIILFEKERPNGSHEIIMNNCIHPFYLIQKFNNYSNILNKKVLFQTISGIYDIRYKNSFINEDNGKILPDETNKIKSNIIFLEKNFEILYINCEVPGILNIHFLENNKKEVNINGETFLYLNSNSKTSLIFPLIKDKKLSGNIFIEQLTFEGRISIEFNNKNLGEISSKGVKTYEIDNYPISVSPILNLISSTNSVVSVIFNLNKDDYFEINEFGKYLDLSYYNLLINIKKDMNFQNFEINMKNIENDFIYKLIPLNSSLHKKYIPLPENTPLNHFVRVNNLQNHKWNYKISDPYNKLNSNSDYYIFISFDKKNKMPNYKIKIEYNKKLIYPILEKNKILTQYESGKNTITGGNTTDYLIIITHKCGNIIPRIGLNYYYDNLYSFNSKKIYNMISMKNFYTQMQIEVNFNSKEKYEGIEISYNYINNYDMLQNLNIEFYNKLDLNITFDRSYKRFNWDHLSGADHYLIYILPNTNENKIYIKNDCFLLNQKSQQIDITYYEFYKTGKYIINVVAVFEEPINFRVVYNPIELNIRMRGSRLILYCFLFTLFCIIIYIIYQYGKLNSDYEPIDDKD